MQAYTDQVANGIFADLKQEGITPELVSLLIEDQRFYMRTCHAILIFLFVVLIVIAGWVYLSEPSIDMFGVQLQIDIHKVFLGFLIGNFAFMIELAAFFRVVIYEKLIYACTETLSGAQRKLLRLRGMHFTHVLMAICGENEGLPSRLHSFIAGYVRYFFFATYGVFYYVTLTFFLAELVRLGLPALTSFGATTPHGPAWLFLVYAAILFVLNVFSSIGSMLYLDNTDYRIR